VDNKPFCDKEVAVIAAIDHRSPSTEEIREAIRRAPLLAIRPLLSDEQILDACRRCRHKFRDRRFGPVVTVLHMLAQGLAREESFASTWQELFTPLIAEFPGLVLDDKDESGLTHARGRLPRRVMDYLARQACRQVEELPETLLWGLRPVALDSSVVSMPDEEPLQRHFGTHRGGAGRCRYPLATFAYLLSVGTSLIRDWRMGPLDEGEIKTASPLLGSLTTEDLLLADRRFAGAPFLAKLRQRGVHFLMRKHQRLQAEKLPVLKRLGRKDFITELTIWPGAKREDPTLPQQVPVRLFWATWRPPGGAELGEWFVTSLEDPRKYRKAKLARLYHERWRIETSYLEFKQVFHSDVLRSKTVDNIYKEFAAHILAYQLTRRLIVQAAAKHAKEPTEISFLGAARWVVRFSHHMAAVPSARWPGLFERLLDAIAACPIDVRPGRVEPRMISREVKHYPMRRTSRKQWREQERASRT
jgi:hypothetical protein